MEGVTTEVIEQEFDAKASYYETYRLGNWYKSNNMALMQELPDRICGTLLDIGCGTGWLLRQLVTKGTCQRCVGIDLSSGMVDKANELSNDFDNTNINFLQHNWEDVELALFEEENITAIVCSSSFHYFSKPELAVTKMYSILASGGEVYILEREKSGSLLTRLWDFLHKHFLHDHVQFFGSNELSTMLSSAGFEDIQIRKRIRKIFSEGKMYTDLVIISGKKP